MAFVVGIDRRSVGEAPKPSAMAELIDKRIEKSRKRNTTSSVILGGVPSGLASNVSCMYVRKLAPRLAMNTAWTLCCELVKQTREAA